MHKLYCLLGLYLTFASCIAQNLNQGFENPDITNGGCFSVVGNAFSNNSDFDDRILSGALSMGMFYVAIPPTPAFYISPALPAGAHTFSFYVKPSSCGASEAIEVGTATSPTGTGFTLICSQNMGCSGPTSWVLFSCVVTTNIVNQYIAIRLNGTSKTYFLDDLTITDIGVGLPASCSAMLPVDLLDLHAQVQQEKILLNWRTASERNNKGFLIERSTASDNGWTQLGFVMGKGASPLGNDYIFADHAPARGLNYYRVQQVDLNGATQNFPIVSAYHGVRTRVQLSPNPVQGLLKIALEGETEGEAHALVLDATGRVALQQSIFGNYAELDLSSLSPGPYFVQIQRGSDFLQERVLLR